MRFLEVGENRLKEGLGHGVVANLIGVREVVAAGQGRTAKGGEGAAKETEAIADVIQTDGVGELRMDEADNVAPRREGSRLGIDAALLSESRAGNSCMQLPNWRRTEY